jgi:hypothetical protein
MRLVFKKLLILYQRAYVGVFFDNIHDFRCFDFFSADILMGIKTDRARLSLFVYNDTPQKKS